MDHQKNKEQFIEICKATIHRDGIDALLDYLDKSDFFTAPASTKYHGACVGGLCAHSLNVYNELVRLVEFYNPTEVTQETIAIVALFHDLCKVNLYGVEKRNRKNDEGKWETYDAFVTNEKFCFGGHGSKSVFIIQNYMRLTAEEGASINAHMSCWSGDTSVGKTYEQFPLAWLTHVADEAATFIIEGKKGGGDNGA